MENVKSIIETNRPGLSDQSKATYSSILKNIYDKTFTDHKYSITNFSKVKKFISVIEPLELNTKKTTLAALYILTEKPEYKKLMLTVIDKINHENSKQEMNEKQNESWVTTEQVKELLDKYETSFKTIRNRHIRNETRPNMDELQTMQNYVILALLGGEYIPPRRSKDFVDFKIKHFDINQDNYLGKNSMIFNSYKTAKTYGTQEVKIPLKLARIITEWIKLNPTDYLLFDKHEHQLSNVTLNQRLNKIFEGKKVGVNQLRHTYLTDKYGDHSHVINGIQEDMTNMGSSTQQQKVYIKKKRNQSSSSSLEL